jgi:hypothetical protein
VIETFTRTKKYENGGALQTGADHPYAGEAEIKLTGDKTTGEVCRESGSMTFATC